MGRRYRRSSLGFALLLIAIGALWLFANMHPGFDPWELLFRYWPVILIAIGVGKLIDFFIDAHFDSKNAAASDPSAGATSSSASSGAAPRVHHSHTGEVLAIVILVVLVIAAMSRKNMRLEWQTASRSVEAQSAQKADVNVTIPAGDLTLRGGASAGKILDADFHYTSEDGEPQVNYSVSQGQGSLDLTQENGSHIHLMSRHNDWNLRLNNDIPTNLKVEIGAGHGDLDLRGLTLESLDLEMGAGQVNADLAANWKKDSTVTIQGGVGQATLRLPENIGVSVHASGGIGAISTGGLHKQDDSYVNDAYGKSPVTLEVNVTGGVGQINLVSEP
jgi:hypothetical protein